MILVYSKL